MDNKDQNQRDTFIEKPRHPMIRRDLKRMEREYPERTFNELREEAHQTIEELDQPARQASTREVTINAECNHISGNSVEQAFQELANSQKALIDMMAKLTEKLSQLPPVPTRSSNNHGRCFNCNELGHIKPRCPKLKEQKQQLPAVKKVASNFTSPQQ